MIQRRAPDEEQLDDATQMGVESANTISRMAAERGAGIQGVKARGAKRAIAKIIAGGRGEAVAARLEQLRARASSHEARGAILADQAQLLRRREQLKASIDRAATYGRTVDATGEPLAGVPVSLVSEGKAVACTTTDEQGYFALSAPPDVKGDVVAHIGEGGAHGIYALTRETRPLMVQPLVIRLEGTAAHCKPSSAEAPSKPRKTQV